MTRYLLCLLLGVVWMGQATPQTPHGKKNGWSGSPYSVNGCPKMGCCPDDYCRKACPTLFPIFRCGGPDDYCRKSAPCLFEVNRCGSCDDYCRKSIPCLLCPPWSPFLQCGPPDIHVPCGCR